MFLKKGFDQGGFERCRKSAFSEREVDQVGNWSKKRVKARFISLVGMESSGQVELEDERMTRRTCDAGDRLRSGFGGNCGGGCRT